MTDVANGVGIVCRHNGADQYTIDAGEMGPPTWLLFAFFSLLSRMSPLNWTFIGRYGSSFAFAFRLDVFEMSDSWQLISERSSTNYQYEIQTVPRPPEAPPYVCPKNSGF